MVSRVHVPLPIVIRYPAEPCLVGHTATPEQMGHGCAMSPD